MYGGAAFTVAAKLDMNAARSPAIRNAEQSGRDESVEGVGQNHLKVDVVAHPPNVVAEEHERQHRQTCDQEIAREGQNDVHPRAHHGGFSRVLGGEDPLHVVVRRRPSHAHEHAFEEEHHDEEAEQFVAVLRDLGVHRTDQVGPVEIEVPTEEKLIPTGRRSTLCSISGGDIRIMAMIPTAKDAIDKMQN